MYLHVHVTKNAIGPKLWLLRAGGVLNHVDDGVLNYVDALEDVSN